MLVTVYIACQNYAEFVGRAIESVIAQTHDEWELIVVDDGSTDDSWNVISQYLEDDRIRAIRHERGMGLRATANECLAAARGDWLLRLDADDRLHPYCLDVLTRATERDRDAVLVFSDYFYVDANDQVLGIECLPLSEDGYAARTFPPHGACSLVNCKTLADFGGYDVDLTRQDGHELWLKLLQTGAKYVHVPLPLFYYRRHGESLSTNIEDLLEDRRKIKRKLADGMERSHPVVAVIPIKNTYPTMPDIPFRRVDGRTLIDLTIGEAAAVGAIGEIVVTTDDDRVVEYVNECFPEVIALRRPPELDRPTSAMIDVVRSVTEAQHYSDDVVICLLSIHTPRRTRAHIQMALDTFWLHDVDGVVAVYRERGLMYQMGENGLRPLNPSDEGRVPLEREALYVDSGAVRVFRAANVATGQLLGTQIGHALMPLEDAAQITSPLDFHLLDAEEAPAEVKSH